MVVKKMLYLQYTIHRFFTDILSKTVIGLGWLKNARMHSVHLSAYLAFIKVKNTCPANVQPVYKCPSTMDIAITIGNK